jgi:multidrug efflux pump subunit AcrA (membrane-fusion protein)
VTDEPNTPETTEAPEAETTPTLLSPEDLQRELEKTRKEAAKYRTRLREREEAERAAADAKRQAELTAEQRATEAERKATEALAAAEARVLAAERRASLAGKVANPERVLRLMDDAEAYFDGSTPNVDAILEAFPEYAPTTTRAAPAPMGAPTPGATKALTPEDFRGKSPEWVAENLSRLKPPPR